MPKCKAMTLLCDDGNDGGVGDYGVGVRDGDGGPRLLECTQYQDKVQWVNDRKLVSRVPD